MLTPDIGDSMIDAGQGDSCWLQPPDGDGILVRGGRPEASPTAAAYLTDNGAADFEPKVATHGDAVDATY